LGADVGVTFMKNAWVSLGYNVQGYNDKDFDDAHYLAQGPYLKFRIKFDQDTFKDLNLSSMRARRNDRSRYRGSCLLDRVRSGPGRESNYRGQGPQPTTIAVSFDERTDDLDAFLATNRHQTQHHRIHRHMAVIEALYNFTPQSQEWRAGECCGTEQWFVQAIAFAKLQRLTSNKPWRFRAYYRKDVLENPKWPRIMGKHPQLMNRLGWDCLRRGSVAAAVAVIVGRVSTDIRQCCRVARKTANPTYKDNSTTTHRHRPLLSCAWKREQWASRSKSVRRWRYRRCVSNRHADAVAAAQAVGARQGGNSQRCVRLLLAGGAAAAQHDMAKIIVGGELPQVLA